MRSASRWLNSHELHAALTDPLAALDIDRIRQQHQQDEHAQCHETRLHDTRGAGCERHGDERGQAKIEAVLLPEEIRDADEQRDDEESKTGRLTDPGPDRQRPEDVEQRAWVTGRQRKRDDTQRTRQPGDDQRP